MSTVIENEQFRNLLRSRPAEAVVQLYTVFGKKLLNYATMLTQDDDVAKDIVQDAFLQVLSNSKQLSNYHELSIEHYLAKIVRYRSISHYKRVRHVRLDTLLFPEDRTGGAPDNPIEKSIIEQEIIAEIRSLIATFPPREQECFLLMIDHNLNLDLVAERLNIGRKAVERSVTSARKRLREWAAKL